MDSTVNKATTRVAILGAGMSGLGAAAKLKEAGYSVIDIFDGSRLVWSSQKVQLPVYKK
jgi:cation diffusion facilitator CzcD-associated flavoprotein CzcO